MKYFILMTLLFNTNIFAKVVKHNESNYQHENLKVLKRDLPGNETYQPEAGPQSIQAQEAAKKGKLDISKKEQKRKQKGE